ncbi:hypothetical protein M422DRAFT_30525, partial [Sphaerobolus stellatus SS14]
MSFRMRPRAGIKSAALEVFKFGLYLFVPFAAMVTITNPDWYKQVVVPYREYLMPKEEETYVCYMILGLTY